MAHPGGRGVFRTTRPASPAPSAWGSGTFAALIRADEAAASVAAERAAVAGSWHRADAADIVPALDRVPEQGALTSTNAGAFVAFGTAGDRLAAWMSADGDTWVESAVQPSDVSSISDDPALPTVCSGAGVNSGLVAAVLVGGDTLVWTSRDGVSWGFDGGVQVGTALGPGGWRVLLAGLRDHVLLAGLPQRS